MILEDIIDDVEKFVLRGSQLLSSYVSNPNSLELNGRFIFDVYAHYSEILELIWNFPKIDEFDLDDETFDFLENLNKHLSNIDDLLGRYEQRPKFKLKNFETLLSHTIDLVVLYTFLKKASKCYLINEFGCGELPLQKILVENSRQEIAENPNEYFFNLYSKLIEVNEKSRF